jgi:hypothetical protein
MKDTKDTMTIIINHSSVNDWDSDMQDEWNCWELETFTNEHEFTGFSWGFQLKRDAVAEARRMAADMVAERAYSSVTIEVHTKAGELDYVKEA